MSTLLPCRQEQQQSCAVECPVCLESFASAPPRRRPRVLPCGHGVCSECSLTIVETKSPTCPCCRRPAPAPPGGYVLNYALLGLLDGHSSPEPAHRLLQSAPATPRHSSPGKDYERLPMPVSPTVRRVGTVGAKPMTLRVVIAGSPAVGKSALTLRFVQNFYPDVYDPTILDIYRKEERVDDGPVIYEVVDTAGQEEYRMITRQYYQSADAALLVFSVDLPSSLSDIPRVWAELCAERSEAPPAVIVAHKCDLTVRNGKCVSEPEIEQISRQCGLPVVYASAKSGAHVDKVFHKLARDVRVATVQAHSSKCGSEVAAVRSSAPDRKPRRRRRLLSCSVQ
eukprot:TRINITY_DN4399_c0_g1_i1.p1 TRINITY_DN4399_c0_g1~~TRINITY_DN4399_c0_g1_i1.p1  ORF type:complete len:339 (+),score=34.45 TRINITY_DN4399_c0_g1_i1:98-1114(+)